MHCSAVLALLGAALAIASPVHQHERLHKKDVAYDIITDVVYVTVTEGDLPSSTPDPTTTVVVSHTNWVVPVAASPVSTSSTSSSSTSSTATPEFIEVPTTTAAPPAPSTTSTPAPAPATTQEVVQAAAVQASSTPVAATTASDNGVTDSFSSTGVSNHNDCRSQHSAGTVTWNQTLADWAAITAKTCVFAHDMGEGTGAYGQNIAAQGSSDQDAWTLDSALQNAIIDEWYSEESLFTSLYGLASPSGSGDFLHFTQIVWKESTSMGCAVQACNIGNSIYPTMYTWFTVCNYFPQGNVEGYFNDNVFAS